MFIKSSRPLLVGLAFICCIAGCGNLSPAGLIAASRLDPLNVDPGDISVAVGVPSAVRLSDGDAVFRISFRVDPDSTETVVDERVPLKLRLGDETAPPSNGADEVVYVAQFSPENAARVARAQAEIRALRARGIEGAGAIAVTVEGGCYASPSLETLPSSTWLRTDPAREFVQLTRRIDALAVFDPDDSAVLRNNLSRC